MRDPYHAARQRFKVARDRLIELQTKPLWVFDAAGMEKPERYARDESAELQREWQRKWTANYCAAYRPKRPTAKHMTDFANPLIGQLVEAAGILTTMQKWKTTDEKQALVLWKLTRD